MKDEALKHYDKMINYVETKDADEKVDSRVMEIDIGTNWYGKYCVYCQKYWDQVNKCGACPLFGENDACCNGLWSKMNMERTYGKWLLWGKEVREYIKENG